MEIRQFKNIEYSVVSLSELGQEMRFDADYWHPSFLRNEATITSKEHIKTKIIAPNPQYGISVAMNEEGNGYPILKMDNIIDILAEDNNAKSADIPQKVFRQFQLKKFDVLFNRVNSDDYVGRTGIYLLEGEHTFASYLVRIDSGVSHVNCYLSAYLNCIYGKTALQRVKRRSVNQANINAKELSNLHIPFPSHHLQIEIQNLIVDAQKEKDLSEHYYKQAEHLLLNAIGLSDWKPKTRNFNLCNVGFEVEDSISEVLLSSVVNNDRLDSDYWDCKYLDLEDLLNKHINIDIGNSQYFDLITGIYSNKYTTDDGKFYIRSVDITNRLLIDGKSILKTPNNFSEKFEVQEGDILTSRVGSIGTVGYVTEEFIGSIISDNTLRIRIKPNVTNLLPLYCAFYLSIVGLNFMKRLSRGSVQQRLNQTTLKSINIPVIDASIQINIDKLLKASFASVSISKKNLENAKRAVEIFIEQDENEALKYLSCQQIK